MSALFRQVFLRRWMRIQGGSVSLLPILVMLALAIGLSYLPRHDPASPPGLAADALGQVHFSVCAAGPRTNCVVDGDTIWASGEKIRLADIDAPEIFSPHCASEKALGDRATLRLAELLNAGDITLQYSGARTNDRYHRKLRVAEVNGQSVGVSLVREGLARRWDGARRSWCQGSI